MLTVCASLNVSFLRVSRKDGEPYAMPMDKPLYRHFVVPEYPVLAVSAQLFTTCGPKRAMNSAELCVSQLCVERQHSERSMLRSTSWQMCKQRMDSFILFMPNFWQNLILLQADLILHGVLPWWAVLSQYVGIAVLGRQDALPMHILPALKNKASSAVTPSKPLRDVRTDPASE